MAKKVIKAPDEQLPSREPERTDEQLYDAGEYVITEKEDFTIDVPLKKIEKRWTVNDYDFDKKHEVVFKMWSYEEGVELRKKSTQYDDIKRVHYIDHDLFNRLKIQKLVKSWTFEEENPKLKMHHVSGVLTDESFKAIMSLHPNILRYIIERMNDVLEYNG
jgi:hypothetical protein